MNGHKPVLIVAILGAALCFSPAQAASAGADKTADREKPAAKKDEGRPTDTESCKRDAAKLHGPERARFMTECLRKRD